MTVVKAGPSWEIVATNDFEDESFSTPAIADDAIYVRTRGAHVLLPRRSRERLKIVRIGLLSDTHGFFDEAILDLLR